MYNLCLVAAAHHHENLRKMTLELNIYFRIMTFMLSDTKKEAGLKSAPVQAPIIMKHRHTHSKYW